MKYRVSLVIENTFEADNEDEARKEVRLWQNELAESNDGSEMLANADFTLVPIKE